MNNINRPIIRIEEQEVSKLSETLFESLLTECQIIFTREGKDTVVSVPYDDYVKMQDTIVADINKDE